MKFWQIAGFKVHLVVTELFNADLVEDFDPFT